MKIVLIAVVALASSNIFAQTGTTKAKAAVLPTSVQAHDTVKAKKDEAPCDTKEDILKKMEEEKKKQASAGKGFSLQGKTDTGCTIK